MLKIVHRISSWDYALCICTYLWAVSIIIKYSLRDGDFSPSTLIIISLLCTLFFLHMCTCYYYDVRVCCAVFFSLKLRFFFKTVFRLPLQFILSPLPTNFTTTTILTFYSTVVMLYFERNERSHSCQSYAFCLAHYLQ